MTSHGMNKGGGIPPYFYLLFPAVSFMLLIYGYPFVSSIVTSFIGELGTFSMEHYVKTLDLYLKDILFTFAVTVFNTLLSIALAISFSVYLRLSDSPISKFLGKIYKLGIFIPFVVVSQMMRSFLAPHGILNLLLARIGLINIDKPLQLFNFLGLSFGFIWKLVPFAVLIVYGGFQMIDNSYVEAARSTGAGLFRVVTKILIPMNRASIMVALVLVYAQIVSTFTLPYMLIGGKIPTTITVDIAHRVNYFRDFGVANSLGVISYLLVLFTAIYYLRSSMQNQKSSKKGEVLHV